MKSLLPIAVASFFIIGSCENKNEETNPGTFIANGQMPNITKDNSGTIHLVYGDGDSILYSFSADGKKFSQPALIAVLPELAASHMRGPQIVSTENATVVTGLNEGGDIFSFSKNKSGQWTRAVRVNDVDTVAKEGLMALAADGQNVFAIWNDVRDGHNKIFGAKSSDNGNTWSKNILVYTSPDSSICECCKPNVAMKEDDIYVMFRNWLNGNRDLYLVQSADGGNSFGEAQKLGKESWKLNGCPMDGGGITVSNNGIQTVWRRQNNIYSCEPGKPEQKIGEGKNCTIENVNGKNVYAWTEDGEVVVLKSAGEKINLGKGQLPLIKTIDDKHVICIWENKKQIHRAILTL